jgi:hypothetical protein
MWRERPPLVTFQGAELPSKISRRPGTIATELWRSPGDEIEVSQDIFFARRRTAAQSNIEEIVPSSVPSGLPVNTLRNSKSRSAVVVP